MNTSINMVIVIITCLLVGLVSSRFQTEALINWYPNLIKSSLTPPNIAFPIAWSMIYITMGISIVLVLSNNIKHLLIISLFIKQLLLNFSWSLAFFYYKNPLLGFIIIIGLILVITTYIFVTWPINIWGSFLFIPYLLWVLFASYLNGYILINN